jgi:hypothetical protein
VVQRETFRFAPDLEVTQKINVPGAVPNFSLRADPQLSQTLAGLSSVNNALADYAQLSIARDEQAFAQGQSEADRGLPSPDADPGPRVNGWMMRAGGADAADFATESSEFLSRIRGLSTPQELDSAAKEWQTLSEKYIGKAHANNKFYMEQFMPRARDLETQVEARIAAQLIAVRQADDLVATGKIAGHWVDQIVTSYAGGLPQDTLQNFQNPIVRAGIDDSKFGLQTAKDIRILLTDLQKNGVTAGLNRDQITQQFIAILGIRAAQYRLPQLMAAFDEPDEDGLVLSKDPRYAGAIEGYRDRAESLLAKLDHDSFEKTNRERNERSRQKQALLGDTYHDAVREAQKMRDAGKPESEIRDFLGDRANDLEMRFSVDRDSGDLDLHDQLNVGALVENLRQQEVASNPELYQDLFRLITTGGFTEDQLVGQVGNVSPEEYLRLKNLFEIRKGEEFKKNEDQLKMHRQSTVLPEREGMVFEAMQAFHGLPSDHPFAALQGSSTDRANTAEMRIRLQGLHPDQVVSAFDQWVARQIEETQMPPTPEEMQAKWVDLVDGPRGWRWRLKNAQVPEDPLAQGVSAPLPEALQAQVLGNFTPLNKLQGSLDWGLYSDEERVDFVRSLADLKIDPNILATHLESWNPPGEGLGEFVGGSPRRTWVKTQEVINAEYLKELELRKEGLDSRVNLPLTQENFRREARLTDDDIFVTVPGEQPVRVGETHLWKQEQIRKGFLNSLTRDITNSSNKSGIRVGTRSTTRSGFYLNEAQHDFIEDFVNNAGVEILAARWFGPPEAMERWVNEIINSPNFPPTYPLTNRDPFPAPWRGLQ